MPLKKRKIVEWQDAATMDLEGIVTEISTENPRAAAKLRDKILAKIELLEYLPYLGSALPRHKRYRLLRHRNYLMYYRIHRRSVIICAVVHSARLFDVNRLRRE